MSVVHLETVVCKTPNCPNLATVRRGRWANLCDHCREVAVRAAGLTPGGVPRPRKVSIEGGYEQKARELVVVARSLDRALRKFRPAKDELATALAAWRAALDRLTNERGE